MVSKAFLLGGVLACCSATLKSWQTFKFESNVVAAVRIVLESPYATAVFARHDQQFVVVNAVRFAEHIRSVGVGELYLKKIVFTKRCAIRQASFGILRVA